MQKIIPFLTFNDQAEEAVSFYLSVFKEGKVLNVTRSGSDAGSDEPGRVLGITFQLYGQEFIALNGGPHFTFAPGISLFVQCRTQAEIDELWDNLSTGGTPQPCGWLQDKYGVSWQIVPPALGEMLRDPDSGRAARVMQAMLQMQKIDLPALQRAYAAV